MSLRSCLSITVGAGMLLAATPSFASLSWPTNDLAAQGAAKHCADAATAAIADKIVTDVDVAKCTKAAKLAGFDGDRAAALSNRSVLNFQRADYNAAIADSTAALKIDGRLVEAVMNRGAAYLAMHRAGEAVAEFDLALTMAPVHAEKIYFNRAMAREDTGDLKGAYVDYARAAQLAPRWDQPKQQMNRFTIRDRRPIS
jgi:tetratricopeptide (TPR) repeat protein